VEDALSLLLSSGSVLPPSLRRDDKAKSPGEPDPIRPTKG